MKASQRTVPFAGLFLKYQEPESGQEHEQDPQRDFEEWEKLAESPQKAEAVLNSFDHQKQMRLLYTTCPTSKVMYSVDEALDFLFPPLRWSERGFHWKQRVSRELPERNDVLEMLNRVSKEMEKRFGTSAGVCPIRREIYDDCFSELIRQITIAKPHSGVFLARIRDELKLTIRAHETLISATVTETCTEQPEVYGEEDLKNQLNAIQGELPKLEKARSTLLNDLYMKQKRMEDRLEKQNRLREKHVAFLKNVGAQIEEQIRLMKDVKLCSLAKEIQSIQDIMAFNEQTEGVLNAHKYSYENLVEEKKRESIKEEHEEEDEEPEDANAKQIEQALRDAVASVLGR